VAKRCLPNQVEIHSSGRNVRIAAASARPKSRSRLTSLPRSQNAQRVAPLIFAQNVLCVECSRISPSVGGGNVARKPDSCCPPNILLPKKPMRNEPVSTTPMNVSVSVGPRYDKETNTPTGESVGALVMKLSV